MIRPSLTLLATLSIASLASAQQKNVLCYGNSFSYSVWGYGAPEVVQAIADEAGRPAYVEASFVGGGTLPYYATDPLQIAEITNLLPPGQSWDVVVMQGHALEATNGGGFHVANFLTGAEGILTNVRNHSPGARAVMFQTWASSWGQLYYQGQGGWQVPMDMHTEIRAGYRLAVDDLNTTFGAGSAVNAAVGDAVALLEWDAVWYEADLFHPTPAMLLLAAMCIYTSVFEQPVCEIEPVFNPPGPLATMLASQGLGEAEWRLLAGFADRCADPSLRRYPGSGDHLLLETAAGASGMPLCPEKRITLGTQVQVQMRSLHGVFDTAPAFLLASGFVTGAPSGPSALSPELQIPFGSALVLLSAGDLASPLGFSLPLPFTLPGISMLIQGLVLEPSAETGNALFATTDGHEFVFF
jgi:hypothetical protein